MMKVYTQIRLIVWALSFFTGFSLAAQVPDKPNIVFIMVDDGRYDEYRPTGAPEWFVAPNIERIANEGVNFTRTYASTPLCGPSRASVYTGLYTHQNGTYNNGDDLDTSLPLIQKVLKEQGYYTGFIGKYGNGFTAPNEFDYWVDLGDEELYKNTWIKVNGVNVYVPGHITNAFNDYINYFLDSAEVHSDQPFALFFFPLAPHTPNTPRSTDAGLYIDEVMPFPENFEQYASLYPNKYYQPQSEWVKDSAATVDFIMDRYACLIGVDDNVSRIFNRLDEWGETDSSLILFTSDNGYLNGEHKMRAKAFALEESIHVPMFIRYPEWFPVPDTISDDLVELVDIPKTLLDAISVEDTFGYQGYSLRTLAEPDTTRPYAFYIYEGAEAGAASQVPDLRGVRSLDHLYVYSNCDCWTEEFYDMTVDPDQDTNRILQPQYYPLVQQYRNILDSLRIAYGDTADYMTLECNLVGAYEVPDGIDNDCDGVVDDSLDAFIRYLDVDGDGYGTPDSSMIIFGELAGYVSNALDCADTSAGIHPAAPELCDGLDNDCDGFIDDADGDIIGQQIWYFDNDLDGFGDNATAYTGCFALPGYINTGNDCDDLDPADTLGYAEICNLIDDDCDGSIDDADPDILGQTIWYADMDNDGVGNYASTTVTCFMPEMYADNYGDCNDADSSVTHGGAELCNLLDDDCDGLFDDNDPDVLDRIWYFADGDGDGFGDQAAAQLFCFGSSGYVLDSTDCNDLHSAVFPLAAEICDGIDNNCDGLIDDDDPLIVGQTLYYVDADGDGFGDLTTTLLSCSLPTGYVTNAEDCNDASVLVFPGLLDICDGINNDCDLLTDEDIVIPAVSADGPLIFCKTEDVVFSATPVISGFTYQWFKSGIPVAGATNYSYTATTSGNYKVQYTAPLGCITESLIQVVTVNNNPKPSVTNTSASNDLCVNNPVKLTTKNKLGSTFQWYKGPAPLAGATNNKYNATTPGNYKVSQVDINGCTGTSKIYAVLQSCREVAPYQDDASINCMIYPNPNDGVFVVDVQFGIDITDQVTIRVFSMIGQQVYETYAAVESGSFATELRLPDTVPAGIYIVDIALGQYRVQHEMVVE